jgi:hypothetical protein
MTEAGFEMCLNGRKQWYLIKHSKLMNVAVKKHWIHKLDEFVEMSNDDAFQPPTTDETFDEQVNDYGFSTDADKISKAVRYLTKKYSRDNL